MAKHVEKGESSSVIGADMEKGLVLVGEVQTRVIRLDFPIFFWRIPLGVAIQGTTVILIP